MIIRSENAARTAYPRHRAPSRLLQVARRLALAVLLAVAVVVVMVVTTGAGFAVGAYGII